MYVYPYGERVFLGSCLFLVRSEITAGREVGAATPGEKEGRISSRTNPPVITVCVATIFRPVLRSLEYHACRYISRSPLDRLPHNWMLITSHYEPSDGELQLLLNEESGLDILWVQKQSSTVEGAFLGDEHRSSWLQVRPWDEAGAATQETRARHPLRRRGASRLA